MWACLRLWVCTRGHTCMCAQQRFHMGPGWHHRKPLPLPQGEQSYISSLFRWCHIQTSMVMLPALHSQQPQSGNHCPATSSCWSMTDGPLTALIRPWWERPAFLHGWGAVWGGLLVMEVVETPLPPCLPSHGMETGPIWGFPLETHGQSRHGGTCGEMVKWEKNEDVSQAEAVFPAYISPLLNDHYINCLHHCSVWTSLTVLRSVH